MPPLVGSPIEPATGATTPLALPLYGPERNWVARAASVIGGVTSSRTVSLLARTLVTARVGSGVGVRVAVGVGVGVFVAVTDTVGVTVLVAVTAAVAVTVGVGVVVAVAVAVAVAVWPGNEV